VVPAHSARISDIDFSPDVGTLLSVGRDGKIRYWDTTTGLKQSELPVPDEQPYSGSVNSAFPDRFVVVGTKSGRLVAWDLKRNRIVTNNEFHDGPVLAVDYQPGGAGTFLSAGGDGRISIRFPMGERLTFDAHGDAIFEARYSASGKLFYSAGADRRIKIWRSATRTLDRSPRVLSGHLRYVLAVDMSSDEKLIASGGGDKSINVWNVETGGLVRRLDGHGDDVEAIAFNATGEMVVSSSEDKTVRLWDVASGLELARVYFERDGDGFVGITSDGRTFGTAVATLVLLDDEKLRPPHLGADISFAR
jgi:WD40 repeat protein